MIRWPYRYQTLPKCIQVFFLSASPLSALGMFILGFLKNNGTTKTVSIRIAEMRKTGVFNISLFSFALFVSNFIVYMVLRKQKRAIRASEISSTQNNRVARIRRDLASFYVCFGCVFTYVLIWLPELTRQYIWLITGKDIEGSFMAIALGILPFNPICDAFVLVFFNKELKNNLKRIFRRRQARVDAIQMNAK